MANWTPKLLVDEALPFWRFEELFPHCELIRCPYRTLDPAVVGTAQEENAVIVSSDRDFYGVVQRRWLNGQPHHMGAFRAVHVPGHWNEAEPVLRVWSDRILPVIQLLAPSFDDCLLIKLGPYSMHVISPQFDGNQVR